MKYMTILYLPKVSLEKSSTTVIADEATTTMVELLSHISSLTKCFYFENLVLKP